MRGKQSLLAAVSGVAILGAAQAVTAQAVQSVEPTGQQGVSPVNAPPPAEEVPTETTLPADTEAEVVVTGIRRSLERAAEIKQSAVQVVDSVVAQDIGKFPDPTTAAALQRVPGVQVVNNNNNELGGVRIRGLTDITTTVDGREVFTTNGRNFDLQDLPAEALSRVDVFKSQTADLIEGGVAGAIDLKLNKPFSFRKPTVVLSARGNYGQQVDEVNPQAGILLTDRFQTGIGEIGLLVNATFSDNRSLRTNAQLNDRRSSQATPFNTPGFFIPNVLLNVTNAARTKRKQVNGSIQWQAAPSLEVYLDGLYTNVDIISDDYGFNVQPYTTNVSITNIVPTTDCFAVRATAAGQNPTVSTNASGTGVLQTLTPAGGSQTLCNIASATLNNAVANQTTGSQITDTTNKLLAGGFRYNNAEGTKVNFDLGYQTSNNLTENIRTAVGQRIPTMNLETDVDGGSRITVPGDFLLRTDRLSLRNQLIQNFNAASGKLFQAKLDGQQEFDGVIKKFQAGLRYGDRKGVFEAAQLSTPVPFGNIGTASEANARLVSQTSLPGEFFGLSAPSPRLNDGGRFWGPSGAFLRSEAGRRAIRSVYNIALTDPPYEPTREFRASESTLASYVQATYEFEIGSGITLDGVLGVRATRTERTLDTFTANTAGAVTTFTPTQTRRSDTDLLPNATARLKLPGGYQARFSYSKAIRRPEFTSLNPALNLVIDVNPAVLSTGSSGNPQLRPQKSTSFDATLEKYFKGGYIAITGYQRSITDRVVTSGGQETINGRVFVISRPRNLGAAELKGVETSGQLFLDFLPGALSGFGIQGAFTYADSLVKGVDSLAGNPLQGVSKYNYTAGLLYDKFGISGRLIYTYRSKYIVEDITGQVQVRRFDSSQPITAAYVPTLLEYVRPAGRLDFSIGYDINDHLRVDLGGTNVLRGKTKTYRNETFFNGQVFDDETIYSLGARFKF